MRTLNQRKKSDESRERLAVITLSVGHKMIPLLFALFMFQLSFAQVESISGTVKGDDGAPLPGVNIVVKGTDSGTQTDFDGKYSVPAEVGQTLIFTYVGFEDQERKIGDAKVIDVVLQSGSSLGEIVVLGSRAGARSNTESAVPVDAFNMADVTVTVPQSNITDILNATAPSFSSTTHSGMDGTDHVDPAQIRGMGPDQTLVLLNGKRQHTSALVNVNGSTGRGTVGTDLNAIPAFALRSIEVLRDGASAQYGSDAIAGVMNLGLKRSTDGLSGEISYGGNLTERANDHRGDWDGDAVQVDLNYGTEVGKKGGFINLTGSFKYRERTHRAGVRSNQIFDAYNAIEDRAMSDGVDLNSLYDNIGDLTGSAETGFVDQVQKYANEVDYFSSDLQNGIQNATSIADLQGLLGADITDEEIAYRGLERRDFNMNMGQSRSAGAQFYLNSEFPINEVWKIYAFGGYSFKHGSAGAFSRLPAGSNTYASRFPLGFLPFINADNQDITFAAGIEGQWGEWNVDFSNKIGENILDFIMDHTANTSMRMDTPQKMDAGGFRFLQNTMNLDLDRNFDAFEGLNLAFGAEYRHENYKIAAGDEASYAIYDVNGNVWEGQTERPTDFFGDPLPGGSQGFGGYSPRNAVDEGRDSFALYADAEVDFTHWLLVDGAARFEHYSDFGNTLNFKLASRIKLTDDFNFRFAGSTGFRAPSMAQIYFNSISTFFVDGIVRETGTFRNDAEIAGLVGIPNLKEERALSGSAGFTYVIPSAHLTFTLDGYWTKVKDRVILTGAFDKPTGDNLSADEKQVQEIFDAQDIEQARFFANAIDTETRGLDFVITHKYNDGGNLSLKNDLGFNLNKTQRVGGIHASRLLEEAGLIDSYFDEASRIYLEEATPNIKVNLTHNLKVNRLNIFLRNNFYGKTTNPNNINAGTDKPVAHDTNVARMITDLSLGYEINNRLTFTIGANNLFDTYPPRQPIQNTSGDQFIYDTSGAQFGINGRYVFAKLNFKL